MEGLQAALKEASGQVKWVEPENIHVTLKFLGQIPEGRLEALFRGVQEGVEGFSSFSIGLSQVGAFPNLRRPRVIWIGVERGREELIRLQQSLERHICEHGFPKEKRKFSPHLTLGRVKSSMGIEALAEKIKGTEFTSEEIRVEQVVVMKSDLTPKGPIYTPLKRFSLKEEGNIYGR